MNDPTNVYAKNLARFIFPKPAGKDINVLITGKILEKNTAVPPYFLNHSSDLLNKASDINIFIIFLSLCFIIQEAKKYDNKDPAKLPSAPTNDRIQKENIPEDARNPENGIIISDGTGIFALSNNINKKTPVYPEISMNVITQ